MFMRLVLQVLQALVQTLMLPRGKWTVSNLGPFPLVVVKAFIR